MEAIRARSETLHWAIIAVGSRVAAELAETYKFAASLAVENVRKTLGGSLPSKDDIKGCMLVTHWLQPVRPPGHLVAMAYELNLHRSGDDLTALGYDKTRIDNFRLWAQIVLCDVA